jgi:hypothetical protein
MKITPSKIIARKKPTSTAMKSYFDDLGVSEVFVSVVDETPADEVVEADVTDGATLEEAGAAAVVVPTDVAAGEFKAGFAEDGPAVVAEFGAVTGDEEFMGRFGAFDVEGEVGVGVAEPGKEDGTGAAPAVATLPGAEADEVPAAPAPVPVTAVLAVGAVAGLIEAPEFVFEASC